MKILQLTKHYPPVYGGIESVTYDLTEGLIGCGVDCDVLCVNDKNKLEISELNFHKIYRTARVSKIMSTSISPQLIKILRNIAYKYDIIHVHFPDPMAALSLYRLAKIPKIVVHWHSDIVRQKKLLMVYRPLQDWVLKNASYIIATSKNYAEHSNYLKPFESKIRIVPIGIPINKFIFDEIIINQIKNKFQNKKIVFSLGRLVYYKGFDFLVEAAEMLGDNCVVLIGGSGPEEERLRSLIREKKLHDKVYLLGSISHQNIGNYYKACDIFCLPAIEKSEAFGVVLLEAMSFGKPIITSDMKESGVSWVNADGCTGYNVKPQNSKLLAEKINILISNKDVWDKFSANCLIRFNKYFTNTQMIKSILNIYNNILDNNQY